MNSQAIATDLFDALDEASQSIFYVIQDGVFVYGNKIGCRITGLNSLKDVFGKPALTFVHPGDKEMLTRKSSKVMQGKRVQPFEWRLHTLDGSIVWVLGLLVKIHFKGRPALLGNYIDITQFKETRLELKRTSERLEDLAIDIHSIREEERAQIAWEIQENLGHSLESLKIEIIALLKDDSPKQHDKEKLLHKIDSSLDTIKRISVNLKPQDIDRNEFISVIREYAVEFEDKTGIVLKVKAPRNFKNFAKTQMLIFFQAYQIMLNTLFNLGRFKKIDITVQQDNHQLKLRLSVNIKEFKKKIEQSKSDGPFNTLSSKIKERNGRLNIDIKKHLLILSAFFTLDHDKKTGKIDILLGSDQPILMEGIQQILSSISNLSIQDHAETIIELINKIKDPDYDMVLVDTFILGSQATDNLKRIKKQSPFLPILVYQTMGDDDNLAVRMLKHGAAGYISRSSSTNELIAAIHKVAGGRKHINNRIAEKLAFEVDLYTPKPFHHLLSERERQVMFMIAEGKTMTQIASDLCLSYKTIATYRSRLFEKMKMRTNTEIVRYVISKGLA